MEIYILRSKGRRELSDRVPFIHLYVTTQMSPQCKLSSLKKRCHLIEFLIKCQCYFIQVAMNEQVF